MSHFTTHEMQFAFKDELLAALRKIYKNKVQLNGQVMGRNADIVVDRSAINGYANFGFQKTGKTYSLACDSDDKRKIDIPKIVGGYVDEVVSRRCKGKYRVLSKNKGTIRLQVIA